MYGALPLHPDFMIVYGALPHTPQTLSFEKGFDPNELAHKLFLFRFVSYDDNKHHLYDFYVILDRRGRLSLQLLEVFRCVITENISIIFAVLRRTTDGRPYGVV